MTGTEFAGAAVAALLDTLWVALAIAAAAWALAPFATSLTNIAASSTNMQGITNAMLTAQQLADPTTGSSPGSSAPMGRKIG